MLTMLAHQSSWSSLKGLIDDVLGPQVNPDLDPSAVLDFLETCVYLQVKHTDFILLPLVMFLTVRDCFVSRNNGSAETSMSPNTTTFLSTSWT